MNTAQTGWWRVRSGMAAAVVAAMTLASAGSAWGQVRVDGIAHEAVGAASLSPMPDGSLLVSNIGSSGQDGVQLMCDSGWGASMRMSIDQLLAPTTTSSEIRIRPKGWDGTIKGTLRLSNHPPDGTPGSLMDVSCDFADVGALHIRVVAEDSVGNVIYTAVMPASSISCTASVTSPPGTPLSCRLAIKTKGLPVQRNQQLSVAFPEGSWTITGLSSAALHDVAVLGFEPEQCAACDAWIGTESVYVMGSGVPSMVLSQPRLLTFGVSSFGKVNATAGEQCDNAADCDNVRALVVSNLDSSLQDGVAIEFDGGNGGGMTFRRGELTGHVILMKAVDDQGTESSRLMIMDSPPTGGERIICDASATGATEMDLHLMNGDGQILHSSREPTIVLALACTSGVGENRRRCTCPPGYWSYSTQTPQTVTLPDGTPVSGVSTVWFRPVLASPPAPVHAMHVTGNTAAEPIVIRPVNDPPALRTIGGIIAIPMEKGFFTESAEGTLVVTSPCCDDDGDGQNDGVEIMCTSQTGGTVTVESSPLLAAAADGEIKIRFKGWDGTIKGSLRMSGGGGGGAGGLIGLECDFSAMSAVELQWRALDESGDVLGTGTVAGSTLGGITVTPPPDAALLMPMLMKAKEKANKMVCALILPDHDFDVSGLGSTPISSARAIEFTPIQPAGSPPWADLESMQVTYTGMSSLTVLDASLLTFGVVGNGIKDVQIGEVCDDGNTCDESRKLVVHNLGSSGQDGVSLRFGNPLINEVTLPVLDASFDIAQNGCCKGHVTVLKARDDGGGTPMSLTGSSSADGTFHTLAFDASGAGATVVTVQLRDQFDNLVHTHEYGSSIGDISYVGPCDASESRTVDVDSDGMCVQLCDAPVTVSVAGLVLPGITNVCYEITVHNGELRALDGIDITSDATDFLEVSSLSVHLGQPPCAADFDGDGVRAVPDIFAFLSAWFANNPAADIDGTPGIAVPDIFAFLSLWFAGCP